MNYFIIIIIFSQWFGHALLGIYRIVPHTFSTSGLLLLSSLVPACLFLSPLTEDPQIVHPPHANAPLLCYGTESSVSLAAVSILTTEPSTYSLCPVQFPHFSMDPWHLALSCSTGYFLFFIRELSSSVAIEIAHAKYFFMLTDCSVHIFNPIR